MGISPSASFLQARFLRSGLRPCSYYKKTSVWTGLKKLWPSILSNVRWIIGDGESVSFWKDNWLGIPLNTMYAIEPELAPFLQDQVSKFIFDKQWVLPPLFSSTFPDVANQILGIEFPMEAMSDTAIWSSTASGSLNAKEAYASLAPPGAVVNWGTLIWHKAIQPRKSLVAWQAFQGRFQTDNFLQKIGVHLCSQCSLCLKSSESSVHLFMECTVMQKVWVWLFALFCFPPRQVIHLADLFASDLLNSLSAASKLLWRMAVCNLLWLTWTERNSLRNSCRTFCIGRFSQRFLLCLKDSAQLVFKAYPHSVSTIPIFNLLGLSPLLCRAPSFKPVTWQPSPDHWLKVNTDGTFRGSNMAGFGGIFRDAEGNFVGAFAARAEVPSAIDAEILAVIEAIQVAWVRRWTHIWLETDSTLVLTYFKNPNLIPWRLRTRWFNCVLRSRQMTFHISHIFREGNKVADKLANYGALHDGAVWWIALPSIITSEFGHDYSSRTSYRFS
ncbi:putative ribonuclease H-like domain, reverse transcriptase zinc-binding domain-containing protein [Rosa chinensis]|uniref:Putative ribonuclease H-like domain, reverse transcriptase zinc-binding domain-containing protein n=1 Tax=Rosa chinensis TaxID=74649 RepID=A0A2P6QV37_ROSCH|nr:putative ribonuclease H-like domain, reverse transcriptase zinc-binding domain-containing protein [Rosa chinensis]